jgi:multicomponent K+:H+ antiporter subunit D
VPLHWWLPTAYGAASAPAAALFAIMTKVGAYAIIRVYTLVFGDGGGEAAGIAGPWLMPAALAALVVGAMGVLGARALANLVSFAMVWSMGSLLLAVALFDPPGIAAALYYTLHSTFIAAALFLLVELIALRRGEARDIIEPARPLASTPLLAGLFFLAGISMAGLPPLSGFTGKILILDAARASPQWGWIWALVLGTSLVVVLGFARAGSTLFWKSEALKPVPGFTPGRTDPALALAAASVLIAGTALLSAFAGPVTRQLEATAAQVLDRGAYVDAVLGSARTETAAAGGSATR